MLPLGVLAASGAALPGSFEQISTTLITSNTASVTFSSIPGTYTHLQLRMTGRADSTFDAALQIWFRFNGNTSMSYASHFLRGEGSSVGQGEFTGGYAEIRTDSTALITNFSGSTAGAYSPLIMDVLDYANTNKTTTLKALHGYMNTGSFGKAVLLTSGIWNNTAAVTSLYVAPQYGNFVSGTRLSLYGIKV